MASKTRVVITGMGVTCPIGLTLDVFWKSLFEKKSGVCLCSDIPDLPVGYGSPVADFTGKIECFGEMEESLKKTVRKSLKLMSREIQMGVASAQKALFDAGIFPGAVSPERVGTSIGSDLIITATEEIFDAVKACRNDQGRFDFHTWGTLGLPKMNPLWQLKYLPNMPAGHIAIINDFRGPSNSFTLREASIGAAVGESVHIIQRGRADVMLVGATGSRLHPVKMIHAVQTEQIARENIAPELVSRPFDASRLGMILGEGAGAVVLESEDHAQKRGAKIYAEVLGGTYVANIDSDFNAHRRSALIHAMNALFRKTETSPGQIGHVNAHGLSTYSCDIAEAGAIHDVFPKRNIPVTAAKSYFGNLGAGSGAVELIAGVLALQKGKLFPILNNTMGDPDCPIHPVRDFNVPAGDSFVKLAVSPQGQASAILVRRV
ncbi:MAG: beta-ketoacyl-[acyl-carrier-protein] synthase family protein [Planctomycetaceae bacterium]|jgi:3-oxoacyl-[acyl-carrier-protein] synthase II|nr:beta-ketoacyl-[acyl-carrier-protein] synthase family protein [Planctomycetaceae bacterium]